MSANTKKLLSRIRFSFARAMARSVKRRDAVSTVNYFTDWLTPRLCSLLVNLLLRLHFSSLQPVGWLFPRKHAKDDRETFLSLFSRIWIFFSYVTTSKNEKLHLVYLSMYRWRTLKFSKDADTLDCRYEKWFLVRAPESQIFFHGRCIYDIRSSIIRNLRACSRSTADEKRFSFNHVGSPQIELLRSSEEKVSRETGGICKGYTWARYPRSLR